MSTKESSLPLPQNDSNNVRLRMLIKNAGLTQEDALSIFNRNIGPKKYSVSAWKAFLASPASMRWRRFDSALLVHAEKTIGKISKKA